MLQSNTKLHKLGISRAGAGTRVWLEGKRLLNHGFAHATLCERIWEQGKLTIRAIGGIDAEQAFQHIERENRTTIAGTIARPIIDITGIMVARAFPSGNVLVQWEQGKITITGV